MVGQGRASRTARPCRPAHRSPQAPEDVVPDGVPSERRALCGRGDEGSSNGVRCDLPPAHGRGTDGQREVAGERLCRDRRRTHHCLEVLITPHEPARHRRDQVPPVRPRRPGGAARDACGSLITFLMTRLYTRIARDAAGRAAASATSTSTTWSWGGAHAHSGMLEISFKPREAGVDPRLVFGIGGAFSSTSSRYVRSPRRLLDGGRSPLDRGLHHLDPSRPLLLIGISRSGSTTRPKSRGPSGSRR